MYVVHSTYTYIVHILYVWYKTYLAAALEFSLHSLQQTNIYFYFNIVVRHNKAIQTNV